MAVYNRLKDLRYEMKMEQNEFAEYLGAHYTLYNRWEKNRVQPSLEWAVKIAKKTGKHVEDFIYLQDKQ